MVSDKKSNDASDSGGSIIVGLPIVAKIMDIKLDGSKFFAWSKTNNISQIYSMCKAFHRGKQQDLSLTAYVMEFKKMYEELNSLLPISVDVKVIYICSIIRCETFQSPHLSDFNSALISHGRFQGGFRNNNSGRVGDSKGFNSIEVECYYCHELGHTRRNCKKILAKSKGSSARGSATSYKTVTISSEDYASLKGSVNVNSSTSTTATAIAGTYYVEALPEAAPTTTTTAVHNAYTHRVAEQLEVACLMLAEQELFETVKAFHACKQDKGQSVSTYVLKMKAYLDQMECLGYPMPLVLRVNLILTSLSKDYNQFMQNYNMHSMGKTILKLHAMLKLAEKCIPKKALVILAIRQGQIQKPKPQALGKGKKKDKSKLAYDPTHKIPLPAKKEHPAKDLDCHRCHKTRHYRRNCPLYLAELNKNKASTPVTSGIFTIELYSFPKTNSWIYDTGCGTHICNTIQGLRGIYKMNKDALGLYVGNGNRATVKAMGSFD
nr:hypothetical protein [Tanacetum cinerariifolium]